MTAHTGNPTSPDQVEPGSRPVLHFDPELIAAARARFEEAHNQVEQLISYSNEITSPEQMAADRISIMSAIRIAGFGQDCIAALRDYSAQLRTATQVLDTTMKWYLTTDEGKSHAMKAISPRLLEDSAIRPL